MLSRLTTRLIKPLISHSAKKVAPRMFSKKIEDYIEENKAPTDDFQKMDGGFENEEQQFTNDKKNSMYMYVAATITLCGIYFMMEVNKVRSQKKSAKELSAKHFGKTNIGGPWKLHTMDGKEFGSANLDGKYYIIYFGFANCPDICPQTLGKLTKALSLIRETGEKKYFQLETIFVSIDPDRDTPEKIKHFLRFYDPSIIPVTANSNNDPVLKEMMSKFKIYASKIELNEPSKPGEPVPYTLDHTIISYLMSDDNEYLVHIGGNASSADVAQLIINKIMENERAKLL